MPKSTEPPLIPKWKFIMFREYSYFPLSKMYKVTFHSVIFCTAHLKHFLIIWLHIVDCSWWYSNVVEKYHVYAASIFRVEEWRWRWHVIYTVSSHLQMNETEPVYQMDDTYANTVPCTVQSLLVCVWLLTYHIRLQYSANLATPDLYTVKWKIIMRDQVRRTRSWPNSLSSAEIEGLHLG
jgi:hypothetical protein